MKPKKKKSKLTRSDKAISSRRIIKVARPELAQLNVYFDNAEYALNQAKKLMRKIMSF